MRISLVAYEDLAIGDFVSITEGFAGRVSKTNIVGTFIEANAIGVAQNNTSAGNVVIVATDGPTITAVYKDQLTGGENYYVGLNSKPVDWSTYKQSLVASGYTEAYMQPVGTAGSNDQLALDLHPPIYVIPSSLI